MGVCTGAERKVTIIITSVGIAWSVCIQDMKYGESNFCAYHMQVHPIIEAGYLKLLESLISCSIVWKEFHKPKQCKKTFLNTWLCFIKRSPERPWSSNRSLIISSTRMAAVFPPWMGRSWWRLLWWNDRRCRLLNIKKTSECWNVFVKITLLG